MNFLLQQRKREISDSLKQRPPWKLAEEEERKLIMSSFSLLAPTKFIIYCLGGFILSIFCFLPQPSLASVSEGGKKSQLNPRLQVALKYFTAKRKK